eukprot:6843221-Pyramimonas_sp.AAC.1
MTPRQTRKAPRQPEGVLRRPKKAPRRLKRPPRRPKRPPKSSQCGIQKRGDQAGLESLFFLSLGLKHNDDGWQVIASVMATTAWTASLKAMASAMKKAIGPEKKSLLNRRPNEPRACSGLR